MLGEWKLPAPMLLELLKPCNNFGATGAENVPLSLFSIGPEICRCIGITGVITSARWESGVRKDDDFVMDKIVAGCGMLIAGGAVVPVSSDSPAVALD